MKCPYCAEDIKDEAIACKHCTRDLYIFRPLLERLKEVTERLDKLEVSHAQLTAADPSAAGRLGGPLAGVVDAAVAIDRKIPILSPFSALALIFIILVAAHFLIIVQFDLSLVYLRVVSIIVPAVFGFLYRGGTGYNLLADFAAGFLVAILSILTMSAIVGKVDDVAVLPQDAASWREFAEYGASITFGFFTGVIARHGLAAFQSASLRSSKLIGIVSTYIAMKTKGGTGKDGDEPLMEKRLKQVESMISSVIAIGSAVISVIAGLYQFVH